MSKEKRPYKKNMCKELAEKKRKGAMQKKLVLDDHLKAKIDDYLIDINNSAYMTDIAKFLEVHRNTLYDTKDVRDYIVSTLKVGKVAESRESDLKAITQNSQLKLIQGYQIIETEDRLIDNAVVTLTKTKQQPPNQLHVLKKIQSDNPNSYIEQILVNNHLQDSNKRDINHLFLDELFTVQVNPVHKKIMKSEEKRIGLIGGSGSGKTHDSLSYFARQLLLDEFSNLLVVRCYSNTIKESIYSEYLAFFNRLKLVVSDNSTDKIIIINYGNNRRNQTISFDGVDTDKDIEKIKGKKTIDGYDFNLLHIEECSQIRESVFNTLPTRLRSALDLDIKILFTTNPLRGSSWLKSRFIDNIDNDWTLIKSTFRDNNHLTKDYIEAMEQLKIVDPLLYEQYANGEWVSLGKTIFDKDSYTVLQDGDELNEWVLLGYAYDIGYTSSKTALIACYRKTAPVDKPTLDGYDYLYKEIYYKPTPQLDMLPIIFGENKIAKYLPIFGDPAQPDAIDILKQHGYNVLPAVKGAGSILKGIGIMQAIKPHIIGDNLEQEIVNYEWHVDNQGNTIEKPSESCEDHLLDSCRYFTQNYVSRRGY